MKNYVMTRQEKTDILDDALMGWHWEDAYRELQDCRRHRMTLTLGADNEDGAGDRILACAERNDVPFETVVRVVSDALDEWADDQQD